MLIEQNNIKGSEGPKSLDNAQGNKGDGVLGDLIHEAHSAMAWVALHAELAPKENPIQKDGGKEFLVFSALAHEGNMLKDGPAEGHEKIGKSAEALDPAEWLDAKLRKNLQPQTA